MTHDTRPPVDAVFSASSGRMGSKYLTTLFTGFERTHAVHEPIEHGFGEALRRWQDGDVSSMREIASRKVETIERLVADRRVYVETNHCFVKGFGWHLAEFMEPARIGLVVLDRDTESVVASLHRIGCLPLNPIGREFILTPDCETSREVPPSFFGIPGRSGYRAARVASLPLRALGKLSSERRVPFDAYQRACLDWYVRETRSLTEAFIQAHPDVRVFRTTAEQLNERGEVERMAATLGLELGPAIDEVIGRRVNLKRS